MKILLVHRYFWPDHSNCGQILWHLTKYLGAEGHSVEVLTSLPSKDLNSKKIFAKKKQIFKNIKIRRIDLMVEFKNPLKKIINGLILAFWTIYLSIKNKYDVIIATSVPPISGGFFGALAAYISKSRFVYFCLDLYPEVGKIYNDFLNPIIYKILTKIDNWTCRRANPIVVHSKDIKDSINSRNGSKNFKIEIINNFSIPTKKVNTSISKMDFFNLKNKKLTVIFAGNIGRFQALDKILDAMILIKNRRDIELIIVGDGSEKNALSNKIKKTNVNVRLFGQQPNSIVKNIIYKADIGLVSLYPNIYKYGYPGKIMTYLEQGKPIIAALEKESEIAKLMYYKNYGFCVSVLKPKKIAQLLIKLAENKSWKSKMNYNARIAYKKYFSKNKILNKWSNILSF
jgi:glycosyltransferase involved in cell wall biosynthesis